MYGAYVGRGGAGVFPQATAGGEAWVCPIILVDCLTYSNLLAGDGIYV